MILEEKRGHPNKETTLHIKMNQVEQTEKSRNDLAQRTHCKCINAVIINFDVDGKH